MGETSASIPPSAPHPRNDNSSSVRLKRAELRRHPRFKTDEATAEVYVKGLLTTIGIGRKNEARAAVNLSEGGLLVLTNSKLKPGARVQFKLEIEKYNDVIQGEGEVRWCYQSAREASDFYAGIQFKDLAPAQKALIDKMRSWFTSPEYKQKSATRRRLAPPEYRK
jgi:Tfp pilus assembly protein PilZ